MDLVLLQLDHQNILSIRKDNFFRITESAFLNYDNETTNYLTEEAKRILE